LVLLLVSGVVVARTLLRPVSWGEFGSYRGANVEEQRNKEVQHYGAASCKNCHEKQWKLREDGEMHMKVSCEVCHGPLAPHATGPRKGVDGKKANMPINKSWELCAKCHRKMQGRPEAFPQIVIDEKHTKGEKIEGSVCKGCHDPHSTMFEEEAAKSDSARDDADKTEKKEAKP
jgi:protein-arginine kinase activator protein McsA